MNNHHLSYIFTGLLLQYVSSFLTNSVAVQTLPLTQYDTETVVGTRIYPTLSFSNHSCFANACVYSHTSQKVLMSLLEIKKGEQASNISISFPTLPTNFVRKLEHSQVKEKESSNLTTSTILAFLW